LVVPNLSLPVDDASCDHDRESAETLADGAGGGAQATLCQVTSTRNVDNLLNDRQLVLRRLNIRLDQDESPGLWGPNGRYEIKKRIGHGNMGAVFLARDRRLGRNVAIKMVASVWADDALRQRLLEEARALARVKSDHVIAIHDIDRDENGVPFISMEFVEGEQLGSWQRGRDLAELLTAYSQAGQGLADAHDNGIVHQDFKPANLMLSVSNGQPRVIVVDFGLAGVSVSEAPCQTYDHAGLPRAAGGNWGTPAYAAPDHDRTTPAYDQHTFCVALWEAVSGGLPWPGGRKPGEAVPARPSGMPAWLYRVLTRGLALEPGRRYPSMRELLAALESGRTRRRRFALVGMALASLAAVVVAGVMIEPEPDICEREVARIDELWSPAARLDLQVALDRDAADLTPLVLAAFDEATSAWRSKATQVCRNRDSTDLGAQREAERCLSRWYQRIEGRLARLQASDRDALTHIDEWLSGIVPVFNDAGCEEPTPPLDPGVERRLELSREREDLGHYEAASVAAAAAVDLAHSLPPCHLDGERSIELAAAEYRVGVLAGEAGQTAAALEHLEHARMNARVCGETPLEATILTRRASTMLVHDPAEHLDAAGQSLAELELLLEDPLVQADPLTRLNRDKSRALYFLNAEQLDQALAAYHSALATARAAGIPAEVARIHQNIAVTYAKQQDLASAERHYAEAVRVAEHHFGASSALARRTAAEVAVNRAQLALELGELREGARLIATAAATLAEHDRGGLTLLRVKVLEVQIRLAEDRNRLPEAAGALEELRTLLESGGELPLDVVAEAQDVVGVALLNLRDERAVGHLASAVALWRHVDETQLPRARLRLAEAHALAGRPALAAAHLQGALWPAGELPDDYEAVLAQARRFQARLIHD
jgi:predicted Ser/Thr protein kinase/tetratricopeptide (TPR) repeat protein